MESIKRGLTIAGTLAIVGGLFGAMAGWWGIVRADGVEAVASESAPLYLGLAVILPLILVAMTLRNQRSDEARAFYTPLSDALLQLLTAGLGGAIFASALFVVGAFQISAVFGGEDATPMMEALRPKVFENALLVIGVTTLAALIIALWANRQASSD